MFGRYNNTNMNNDQRGSRTERLQFSHTTQVYFVPSLSDFSQEEINATWPTEEDTANIRINTIKTVKRMRKGKDIDEEKYCARGLEHMRTADHLEQRKINKASVCNAVLAEQKRQRQSECYDPMRICAQSRLHSEKSRDEALRLGASDAVAAGYQLNLSEENTTNAKNVFTRMISKIHENLGEESRETITNARGMSLISSPGNNIISKAA